MATCYPYVLNLFPPEEKLRCFSQKINLPIRWGKQNWRIIIIIVKIMHIEKISSIFVYSNTFKEMLSENVQMLSEKCKCQCRINIELRFLIF